VAYEIPGFKLGVLLAGADLSTHQYKAVKVNGSGAVVLAAALTDGCIGILQNAPTSGQPCEVMVDGVSKFKAGAGITAGAVLSCGTDGRPITAAGVGTPVIGVALETVANANEIGSALINMPVRQMTA
jgi:hypothetical protein